MTDSNPSYVLQHRSREIARLIAYAQQEAEDVRMVCRRACLGTGDCAIDVGCGPLGALPVLSEVVGDAGVVYGLDFAPAALTQAQQLLDHLSVRNVHLIEADLNSADFDGLELRQRAHLAYCRLVLVHQRDPVAAFSRLIQLVRPGGYLAYQDILDDPPPRCEPLVPAQTRAWELVMQLFARRSVATGVARDHAQLAAAAGCSVVHQRGKFPVVPAAEGFGIVQQVVAAVRAQLVEVGLATSADLDALNAELECAKAGSYRYWHGPLAVETLVRTPES